MRPPRRHPSRRNATTPPATSAPPRRSPRLAAAAASAARRPTVSPDMLEEYPYLPEEMVDNILVRIRPGDPAGLAKSCLGSKFWRRHIGSEEFLRRNRALHPAPALLGFVADTWEGAKPTFLTTSTFRLDPSSLPCRYKVLDARHGRVLFHDRALFDKHRTSMVIWDPITGDKHIAPMPMNEPMVRHWTAVLRCGVYGCHDLRCHHDESTVIFVGTSDRMETFAALYWTENEKWNDDDDDDDEPIEIVHADAIVGTGPSVVLGNKVYFPCTLSNIILEYDHDDGTINVVASPVFMHRRIRTTVLTKARDGVLGFACVAGSKLNLWSREATGPDGAFGWMQYRVLDLATLPRITRLLGSGDGIVVVKTRSGVFTINLESGHKVKMVSTSSRKIIKVAPYEAFCTPSLRKIDSIVTLP